MNYYTFRGSKSWHFSFLPPFLKGLNLKECILGADSFFEGSKMKGKQVVSLCKIDIKHVGAFIHLNQCKHSKISAN